MKKTLVTGSLLNRLPQRRGFGPLVSRLHLGGATAAKATPNPKEIICRLEAISAALGEIRYALQTLPAIEAR
jgi:hypothetical protein